MSKQVRLTQPLVRDNGQLRPATAVSAAASAIRLGLIPGVADS